jgi:hypothetical protein
MLKIDVAEVQIMVLDSAKEALREDIDIHEPTNDPLYAM